MIVKLKAGRHLYSLSARAEFAPNLQICTTGKIDELFYNRVNQSVRWKPGHTVVFPAPVRPITLKYIIQGRKYLTIQGGYAIFTTSFMLVGGFLQPGELRFFCRLYQRWILTFASPFLMD